MAHHHLLPFLALILLILPSPSHAQVPDATPALFSDSKAYLPGGQNLTNGDLTLSLSNDCGLILYKDDSPVKDFNTSTTTSGCLLSLNSYGQLVLRPSYEPAPTQIIGEKGEFGDYAMLFIDGSLGIFGPASWSNSVPAPGLKQESLHAAMSNNFLVSPNYVNGNENGDVVIGQNSPVSVVVTNHCTLSVMNDANEVLWESNEPTNEQKTCFLVLLDIGELLLQYYEGSQLHTQWTGGSLEKYNLYVAVLRYNGRITIYGHMIYLPDMVVAENIKMVTA